MRKLATIRTVQSIEPIKGKDRVELAHVDGWTCMVSKADSFTVGSLCIFCEPDSVFPATDQWKFLEKYNYRIKTQKFKDADGNLVYSQGLVLPLSVLPNMEYKYDEDVTSVLGITQYGPTMDKEPEVTPKKNYSQWLMRFAWFRNLVLPKKLSEAFPSFVSKTDEERIQNCPSILESAVLWDATEKVDGQSGTFAVQRHKKFLHTTYEFFVCSRNLRKLHKDNSSYWNVAIKYDIQQKLTQFLKQNRDFKWIAIQGECIAPGVQGNKYHVKEADLRVFNVITPTTGRLGNIDAKCFVEKLGLKFVPIVFTNINLSKTTVEDVLKLANGKSELYDTLREGLVFRSKDGRKSFKAISPEFSIKHGE